MPLKIGGITVDGPKTKLLVIPRDGFDIAFKFVAVTDDSVFEALCPAPVTRKGMKKDVGMVELTDDPGYLSQVQARGAKREAWYVIQSLKPSQIEWETVKESDPETWSNWRIDLKNAGFSILEINTIYATFLETNMVTDEMLTEARNRFLASQQAVPAKQ